MMIVVISSFVFIITVVEVVSVDEEVWETWATAGVGAARRNGGAAPGAGFDTWPYRRRS
jgi:hypothetical protein